MRSRSKCASFSSRCTSCISTGPRGPAVTEFWSSSTGLPNPVVSFASRLSLVGHAPLLALCSGNGCAARLLALTLAAHAAKLHGDRVGPADAGDLAGRPDGVQLLVLHVADEPAARADEVMVPGRVGVVARRPRRERDPRDQPALRERRERAVHGVQRDRRHPLANGLVHRLHVGVRLVGGDHAQDLEPLMRQTQARVPDALREQRDAALDLLIRYGHVHLPF